MMLKESATPKKMPFVIAIDGPAASGKGTLARKIAAYYGLAYLDTGLIYRAVAYALLQKNIALDDEAAAISIAKTLNFSRLDSSILSANDIGNGASKIAVMGNLRKILVQAQQEFAQQLPGSVLDGRDIGTVVCKNAQIKLYIEASVDVRAKRRFDELSLKYQNTDNSIEYDAILQDLKARDARDMGRAEGPLKAAEDAHLLDTTKLSIEAAFNTACAFIDPVFEASLA